MAFTPPPALPGASPAGEPGTARPEPPSLLGWMRRAPVERATLPVLAAAWSTSEVLHAAGVSPAWPALAGLACAVYAYQRAGRRSRLLARRARGQEMKRNHAVDAAGCVLALAAWMTAAIQFGPLAGPGPWPVLTIAWLILAGGGYWWLRGHEGVRHARHWRARKMSWLGEAHRLGIGGSHMTDYEVTDLGEAFELDTTGTGRRASAIAASDLAERIAEHRSLPVSRVKVARGAIAGRVRVSVRERDPWAHPSAHPLLDPAPRIALPVPCSVRDPAVIGTDPETGDPFTVPLYDDAGGKRVILIGTTRKAGKTVALNCLRERVTACDDALLIDINLSKAIEDRAWAPACHLTAIGPGQAGRAQQIMNLLVRLVDARPGLRDTAVFQPSREHPAVVVVIDEIDAAAPHIARQLRYVMSKAGSEGVTVVLAGQRGTAEWLGGGDIRALVDVFLVGMVSRSGEQVHAAGNLGLEMPDMASYGEGARGVWARAELGESPVTGRTFLLAEPPDLRAIAHERARWQPVPEPELAAALGGKYEALLASDAFAEWAATDEGQHGRDDTGDADRSGPPLTESDPALTEGDGPLVTLARAIRDGTIQPNPDDPGGTQALADALAIHDEESLRRLDEDMEDALPDDLAARLRQMDARNADTRRLAAEADALEDALPDVDPAVLAAANAQRWDQAIDSAPLPDDARERLLGLLAGEGTSVRKAAEALGVTRWTAHMWLKRLAREGAARLDGRGSAARWLPAGITHGDDAGEGDGHP